MQAGEEGEVGVGGGGLVGRLMDEPFAESAPLLASRVAVCQVLRYAL